jgi:hypothetical protein
MGWTQVPTFYFTAISPQTTLTLASGDVTTSSCGPVVDNIVIMAGELPSSSSFSNQTDPIVSGCQFVRERLIKSWSPALISLHMLSSLS